MVVAAWLRMMGVVVEIMIQVGVHARAGINANQSWIPFRVVARSFQCFPGALQKKTVLRVHAGCLARAIAKEESIELLDIGQNPPCRHIVGVLPQSGSNATLS